MSKISTYDASRRANIVGDNDQIESLLDELKETASKSYRRVLDQAAATEKIASGTGDRGEQERSRLSRHDEDYPRAPQQILQNLILTYAALMTRDRPGIYAVPARSDMSAVSAAKIFTKVIEYTESEQDIQDKWHTTARAAAYGGTGFMYIYFDPAKARVEWRPLSVHDVILQDVPDQDAAQWCVVREFIDRWTAEEAIAAGTPEGQSPPEPAVETYTDGSGDRHEGVAKWTIWYRPCYRYPTGLYAAIIGNTVVESSEYPYVWPEGDGGKMASALPVVWWYCQPTRGAILGGTWAAECSRAQVSLDALNSKLLRQAQQAQPILVLPQSMKGNEGMDPGMGYLYVPQGTSGGPEWISPAPLDPNQQAEKANLIQSMYDTAGISQVTAGNNSGQSGRQLAYQAELDTQKHAGAFKSFERAIKAAWVLDLRLKQKFYTIPQQLSLSDGGTPILWSGSDIDGIDIRLEPRSSREGAASTKVQRAREDVAAGFAPLEALAEASPTPTSAAGRIIADDLIARLVAGEDVQITPESGNPAEILAAIDRRMEAALLNRDIRLAQALADVKNQLMRDLAMAEAQMAGPAANTAQAAAGGAPTPLPESVEAEGVTASPAG